MLPDSLSEVQHRARDIMFSDKALHNVMKSKAITYYLRLINDLHKLLEDNFDSSKREDKKNFEKIHARYKKVTEKHCAEIKGVYYIIRSEQFPSPYENADFSVTTIKNLIREGELRTNQKLQDIKIS